MSMSVVPFEPAHARDAATLFVTSLRVLRARIPALPLQLDDVDVDVVATRPSASR
jgi:hypothetical protein